MQKEAAVYGKNLQQCEAILCQDVHLVSINKKRKQLGITAWSGASSILFSFRHTVGG